MRTVLNDHRRTHSEWITPPEKLALGAAKQTLNRRALPEAADLQASQALFYKAFTWPGTAPRVKALMARGIGTRGDLEMLQKEFEDMTPAKAWSAIGFMASRRDGVAAA